MQERSCNKETPDKAALIKAAIEVDYFLKLPPEQQEKIIASLKDLLSVK